ncbi:MAG: DNA methyltransferase [Proteobacteria bacterium]|nr:DNA methyltransferase [Pseudomonadota bacterium]
MIRHLIIRNHYLHAMPAAGWRCFGIYAGQELKGAAVFTAGPRHGYRVLVGGRPQHVAVLARLWLADDLPKNSESRVLGILLRHAKREKLWKLILSYADPAAGHSGIIYRATGWLYLGRGQPSRYLALADGQVVHPRTAYDRFGSNNAAHLSRTGIIARHVSQRGKHRYAYILDPSWRWRLREAVQPYPGKDGAP